MAIMYGMYFDLSLDYAGLIAQELFKTVEAKQANQKSGKEPENMVYGRYLDLFLTDSLFGNDVKPEDRFPSDGEKVKVYEMKNHKPTIKGGYPNARPLPSKMLEYLGEEERSSHEVNQQ